MGKKIIIQESTIKYNITFYFLVIKAKLTYPS